MNDLASEHHARLHRELDEEPRSPASAEDENAASDTNAGASVLDADTEPESMP